MDDEDFSGALELDELSSLVLECADLIPPGRVASYGDIAAVVGTGPRQVGKIMATHGHLGTWWRVVRSDGTSQVAARGRVHWEEEGITFTEGVQLKVRMARHRLTGEELREIAAQLADLGDQPQDQGIS